MNETNNTFHEEEYDENQNYGQSLNKNIICNNTLNNVLKFETIQSKENRNSSGVINFIDKNKLQWDIGYKNNETNNTKINKSIEDKSQSSIEDEVEEIIKTSDDKKLVYNEFFLNEIEEDYDYYNDDNSNMNESKPIDKRRYKTTTILTNDEQELIESEFITQNLKINVKNIRAIAKKHGLPVVGTMDYMKKRIVKKKVDHDNLLYVNFMNFKDVCDDLDLIEERMKKLKDL